MFSGGNIFVYYVLNEAFKYIEFVFGREYILVNVLYLLCRDILNICNLKEQFIRTINSDIAE